jgi:hypothetical protein
MRRNDHDWTIEVSASFDPYANQTTFRIEFLPRLGGFSGPRSSRYHGFDGPDMFATTY